MGPPKTEPQFSHPAADSAFSSRPFRVQSIQLAARISRIFPRGSLTALTPAFGFALDTPSRTADFPLAQAFQGLPLSALTKQRNAPLKRCAIASAGLVFFFPLDRPLRRHLSDLPRWTPSAREPCEALRRCTVTKRRHRVIVPPQSPGCILFSSMLISGAQYCPFPPPSSTAQGSVFNRNCNAPRAALSTLCSLCTRSPKEPPAHSRTFSGRPVPHNPTLFGSYLSVHSFGAEILPPRRRRGHDHVPRAPSDGLVKDGKSPCFLRLDDLWKGQRRFSFPCFVRPVFPFTGQLIPDHGFLFKK